MQSLNFDIRKRRATLALVESPKDLSANGGYTLITDSKN